MTDHATRGAAPPDESTTGRHLPALDGVRGVAVLLVLMRHLFVRNPFAGGSLPVQVVTRLFATGWVGVDLFFVLSGFLITGILYDTQNTPHFFRNFYGRRALRIFPLYYGLIAVLMAISLALGSHWSLRGTLLLLTYTGTLFLQGVGVTDTSWINLNHLWSLQIEEQFYFVWPLAVFLLRTRRRIVVTAVLLASASFLLRCVVVYIGLWPRYRYLLYSWTTGRLAAGRDVGDGGSLAASGTHVARSPVRLRVWRGRRADLAVPHPRVCDGMECGGWHCVPSALCRDVCGNAGDGATRAESHSAVLLHRGVALFRQAQLRTVCLSLAAARDDRRTIAQLVRCTKRLKTDGHRRSGHIGVVVVHCDRVGVVSILRATHPAPEALLRSQAYAAKHTQPQLQAVAELGSSSFPGAAH